MDIIFLRTFVPFGIWKSEIKMAKKDQKRKSG